MYSKPWDTILRKRLSASILRSTQSICYHSFKTNKSQTLIEMKRKQIVNFSTQPLMEGPRETPILLLEGDNYEISSKGISRTLYRMHKSTTSTCSGNMPVLHRDSTMVEEIYDMNKAHKTFILRKGSIPQRSGHDIRLPDPAINNISIQEIDHGIEKGYGTGCTTWEASIVMSMYFSKYPELLRGKVIELGSGIGLGGILTLSTVGSQLQQNEIFSDLKSFTFTDCNKKVMEQCKTNLSSLGLPELINTRVISLNWNDFLNTLETTKEIGQYDTVIASDVAYSSSSIEPLSCTMTNLLRPGRGGLQKIHLFGPNNRAVLHDLIDELKENKNFETTVEIIQMERFRLKAEHCSTGNGKDNRLDDKYLSKKMVEFAHVIVSHGQSINESKEARETKSLIDLD